MVPDPVWLVSFREEVRTQTMRSKVHVKHKEKASAAQGDRLRENSPGDLTLPSRTFGLWDYEKVIFYCLSHSAWHINMKPFSVLELCALPCLVRIFYTQVPFKCPFRMQAVPTSLNERRGPSPLGRPLAPYPALRSSCLY